MLNLMIDRPADIQDILVSLGLQIGMVGDREISLHCPYHTDNHPSFYMNANTGVWICFSCGRKGTLDQFVTEIKGESSKSILRGVKYHQVTRERKSTKDIPKKEEIEHLLLYVTYKRFRKPPTQALESRDIDQVNADYYGLKWNKGWILPFWAPDLTGDVDDLWGWQFKQMKFVSNYPIAIKKSETLFGLNKATKSSVTLVESPLDAVRLNAYGICAVASCGAFVSTAQIKLIIERFDKVFLALDRDPEGRNQTNRLYPIFARIMPTTKIKYPKGYKDVGDLESQQIHEVFVECL